MGDINHGAVSEASGVHSEEHGGAVHLGTVYVRMGSFAEI